MKRRVNRLAYKLDIFKRWRIHSVIFVTQLEFIADDSYKRSRSNHFDFVFVERNTSIEKFYEIEQILVKRVRQYEKINVNQYLIRWKEYESEFDEWKNIFDLNNCIELVKNFERKEKTRSRKNSVNSSQQQ